MQCDTFLFLIIFFIDTVSRQHLGQLRTSLDAAKESSTSAHDLEVVKQGIVQYGDLGYELSKLVNEVEIFIFFLPFFCIVKILNNHSDLTSENWNNFK